MAKKKHTTINLETDMRFLEDCLFVISGKWKIKILLALICGKRRYREIATAIPNINFRMLSKELKQLEINKLITRTISFDNVITYEITEYAYSLSPMIESMISWAKDHREKIRD